MLRDSDDLDTPIVMRMSDNPSVDFDFVSKMLSKFNDLLQDYNISIYLSINLSNYLLI